MSSVIYSHNGIFFTQNGLVTKVYADDNTILSKEVARNMYLGF
jgi:hypothetical protein